MSNRLVTAAFMKLRELFAAFEDGHLKQRLHLCGENVKITTQSFFMGRRRCRSRVWIGPYAVIMPGTTLGKAPVVGAGSVVTHDVPPYAIVYGVPATVQAYREIAAK